MGIASWEWELKNLYIFYWYDNKTHTYNTYIHTYTHLEARIKEKSFTKSVQKVKKLRTACYLTGLANVSHTTCFIVY